MSARAESDVGATRANIPQGDALATDTLPENPLHPLLAFALTAVCYALAGIAVLPLAIPPGYSTPLYPASGVALAAVLVLGRRMLPAIFIGALCSYLWVSHGRSAGDTLSHPALAVGATIALAAALQAYLGAAWVERCVRQPLTLSEPRDILAFLMASMASCLVKPFISSLTLWQAGGIPPGELPFILSTWWIGDLLGVLITTPIVLTLLARPRDAWRPRRLSVGLPLALMTLLLALGIRQVAQWNEERLRTAFDDDAGNAVEALRAQLREPLQALEALNGIYLASDDVSAVQMRLATSAWLRPGRLQAMTWSEFVPAAELAAFEARVRSQPGMEDFHVFDRRDAAGKPTSAPVPGEDVIAVRYIEPLATNAGAVGVNVLSIPATRQAIEAARRSGQPVATAGFRLTQQAPGGNRQGVVLYQAVYAPPLPPAPDRVADTRGMVSVALRMDDQLQVLEQQLPTYLSLCLLDVTPGAPAQRLAGPSGCERRTARWERTSALPYAGRQWEVQVTPAPGQWPPVRSGDVWLFALVGLLSTATLGAFLLSVTGHTHRIETAVVERTAALQAEVHERETAEAALRESEQRFRNILDNVPIGVLYTDLRGHVKQANPRFCKLVGYSVEELTDLNFARYTHPADLPRDIELMAELVRGEIPMYRRHKRYIDKRGTTIWVQASVSLLRDANGRARSIVGVVEDITDQLKLEEAERAREAAEASNRAKSDFLSRMSHELRTPLNAMLGFAQLLEMDVRHALDETQKPWVVQIQQAGWHLLEMINDVLDLSRIESGNLRLQTTNLDMKELLQATLPMVEGEARRRRISITQEMTAEMAPVLGDATRVKQILTNLLSNAVKYNVDDGRVRIVARPRNGDAVEVVVSDTGLGMTPEQLAELFQPFNRLGRERSTAQGTGIGLVISQRLAETMGGSLRAHSTAGQGSSFVLVLPCSTEPGAARLGSSATAADAAAYHRRIVHYVEDNETNVEVMRGILAQRPQVDLHVSVTGLDGLAAIRARRPDLILLDMHLPDISGMELLRHLKQDPLYADVPIVAVSADAVESQIEAAHEAGCAHYLTKPVNVAELLTVLDELLEQVQTQLG